jgi:hypothetical protein
MPPWFSSECETLFARLEEFRSDPPLISLPMKKNLLSIVALVVFGFALTPACGKDKKAAEPAKAEPAANPAPAAAAPAADNKDPKAGSAAGSAAGGW